ncbi:unnamed protein product [Polarella glacialis]|uniref:Pentatricopeptide repeat-containing protein n=1 Tax=Polarella glacialis TaxID=89957 RepID=A0A813I4Z3_POLGL|nr:unnamed protein product [Polarella glacialis]
MPRDTVEEALGSSTLVEELLGVIRKRAQGWWRFKPQEMADLLEAMIGLKIQDGLVLELCCRQLPRALARDVSLQLRVDEGGCSPAAFLRLWGALAELSEGSRALVKDHLHRSSRLRKAVEERLAEAVEGIVSMTQSGHDGLGDEEVEEVEEASEVTGTMARSAALLAYACARLGFDGSSADLLPVALAFDVFDFVFDFFQRFREQLFPEDVPVAQDLAETSTKLEGAMEPERTIEPTCTLSAKKTAQDTLEAFANQTGDGQKSVHPQIGQSVNLHVFASPISYCIASWKAILAEMLLVSLVSGACYAKRNQSRAAGNLLQSSPGKKAGSATSGEQNGLEPAAVHNLALEACVKGQQLPAVLELVAEMRRLGLEPNATACKDAISLCKDQHQWAAALQLLSAVRDGVSTADRMNGENSGVAYEVSLPEPPMFEFAPSSVNCQGHFDSNSSRQSNISEARKSKKSSNKISVPSMRYQ